MQPENITSTVFEMLKKNGFRGKIVSIKHIDELQTEIETQYQKGHLDEKLYDNYLSNFEFQLTDSWKNQTS